MKRTLFILFALIFVVSGISCYSSKKPYVLTEPLHLQCNFTDGEFFKTYEFVKTKTIMPDGTTNDTRTSFEIQHEVLKADSEKGTFIKTGVRKMIIVRYLNNEIVGNVILNPNGEFEKYEGEPGATKKALVEMQKFQYKRVDKFGRLLAYGNTEPKVISLDVDYTKSDEGFLAPLDNPSKISDNPFGWIIPNQGIDQTSFWDQMSYAPLKYANAAAQFKVRMKTKAFTDKLFQVVGYGDYTGKTFGGSPKVQSATYFSQTFFSTQASFVRSHKSESEITYVTDDGKRYRQLLNHSLNNSKVKRDTGVGSY